MELPTMLLADDDIVKIAMIGGLVIAIISIVGGFIRRMYSENVRGRTQREVAAYVAEGSMTPEEGERLIRAANEPTKECA
jgi:hypothetical protein